MSDDDPNPWLVLLETTGGDIAGAAATDPDIVTRVLAEIVASGANPERTLIEARRAWESGPEPSVRRGPTGLSRTLDTWPTAPTPAALLRLYAQLSQTRMHAAAAIAAIDALLAPVDDWVSADPNTAIDDVEAVELADERTWQAERIAHQIPDCRDSINALLSTL